MPPRGTSFQSKFQSANAAIIELRRVERQRQRKLWPTTKSIATLWLLTQLLADCPPYETELQIHYQFGHNEKKPFESQLAIMQA
eukprot:1462331-Amphidinium_carterae.1